ncbi:MAG TPA: hypothetical protein VK158_04245 [Acidobacteriota bacterium]|nr:hypothetical protein [Acidobacteriota bacterium]
MGFKGQVSIFIIVGAVLVLIIGVVFMMSSYEAEVTREPISEEFLVVRDYVESCLASTSEDALTLAGSQGGYIDTRASGITTNELDPTSASGFVALEGTQTVTPYWHYLKSRNNCEANCAFEVAVPPLEGTSARSIEFQLESYISEQLVTCIDSFQPLVASGYRVDERSLPLVDVLFRDDDVRVVAYYDLIASSGEKTQEMTRFISDMDVPFKKMYEFAQVLTAAERSYGFIDKHFVEILGYYTGVDSRRLPPFSDSRNEYVNTVFWIKSQVKARVAELLSGYVGMIQVNGTKNYVGFDMSDISDPSVQRVTQRIYTNAVVPFDATLAAKKFGSDKMNVYFEYLDWPIYFNINADGELIKPNSMTVDFFPFFGLHQFQSYYDVSFPVRVVMTNPDALKGKGYTFSFGLESNVRENEPMSLNYTRYTTQFNQVIELGSFNDANNSQVVGEPLFADDSAIPESYLCEADQMNSGLVSGKVIDAKTGQNLDDASLTFACGDLSCAVGVTGRSGSISSKMPICAGGFLLVQKFGYGSKSISISTDLDEPFTFEESIALEPVRTKPVKLQKYMIYKQGGQWNLTSISTNLAATEQLALSIEQLDAPVGTNPHVGFVALNPDLGPDQPLSVDIIPGTYKVEIVLFNDEELYIPKQTRRSGGLFGSSYEIPEVRMQQYPSGMLTLDETTRLWTVTAEELDQADYILFKLPAFDFSTLASPVVEDLDVLGKYNEIAQRDLNRLMPVLVVADE